LKQVVHVLALAVFDELAGEEELQAQPEVTLAQPSLAS
jgi:hypothetical protein